MFEDGTNRRGFLKAMGLTAASTLLPAGLGASVASAAPSAGASTGLELWLLGTGASSIDAGLFDTAHQAITESFGARLASQVA